MTTIPDDHVVRLNRRGFWQSIQQHWTDDIVDPLEGDADHISSGIINKVAEGRQKIIDPALPSIGVIGLEAAIIAIVAGYIFMEVL